MATTQSFTDDDSVKSFTDDIEAVVEEIEETVDNSNAGNVILYNQQMFNSPPEFHQQSNHCSVQLRREFGNISPISELLDLDDDKDIELASLSNDYVPGDGDDSVAVDEGKVTPEPEQHLPTRTSLLRISDGRSSPILAYSPSLIKSPSSNSSGGKGKPQLNNGNLSPTSSGGVGRRSRNIARMLDNISDHSSGEDDVDKVNLMMTKFTV